MPLTPLAIQLHGDLNNLAREFISIFSLKYNEDAQNLNCPLMRWLDFRMRYVEPRPRNIIYSNRFPLKIPLEFDRARLFFEKKVINGEDINPYQGKGLTRHHDTSSKKHAARTDHLWACWGIVHFHITQQPIRQTHYYSPRSDYIAYCLFDDDTFVFLDIRSHPKSGSDDYADPDLIRIIQESWPQLLKQYELKGIMPDKEMTASEINKLRKLGMGSPLNIKGKAYMEPGFGMTSAKTSIKVQFLLMHIREGIRQLAELIEVDPQFSEACLKSGVTEPKYSLKISEKGLIVYEENSYIGFTLNLSEYPYITALIKQAFPTWAISQYLDAV